MIFIIPNQCLFISDRILGIAVVIHPELGKCVNGKVDQNSVFDGNKILLQSPSLWRLEWCRSAVLLWIAFRRRSADLTEALGLKTGDKVSVSKVFRRNSGQKILLAVHIDAITHPIDYSKKTSVLIVILSILPPISVSCPRIEISTTNKNN